jgi:bifunctional ADP-heptose synthase (sugar kinase/adenylyltransferase)
MNSLREIIERFNGKRIVVFGDLVADVFVYGEIARISRERPC